MVRIMNRITSIISAISIFISCIAGYRTENTEFDDLEALAISAALSYRTLAWNGSIDTDTPEFAWNTAGWYAAYKANLELSDDAVLSGDQLKEIQNVILSGEVAELLRIQSTQNAWSTTAKPAGNFLKSTNISARISEFPLR